MIPPMISVSALNEAPNVRHGFFTREGGVSTGLFASLNCSPTSGDDPAHIAENRARVAGLFDLKPSALITLSQQHGAQVVTIGPEGVSGAPDLKADALVTAQPGLLLGILTADCAPVLFVDPKAGIIGAAHAGWRGALGGVLDNTLAAMTALGADIDRIAAAIGPCIAVRSYEVGPEFMPLFLEESAENSAFFAPSPREGHHLFDLPGYIARRLARLGLSAVARTPCDTYREESRFFSFRRATQRGEAAYGRALSVILLER